MNNSYVIKSLVTCALGAVIMAGCASPSSRSAGGAASNTSSTSSASNRSIQNGKVLSIESAAAGQSTEGSTTSGSSIGGTTASSSDSRIVTVLFTDGTQGRYSVPPQPAATFKTGDPVQVITDNAGIVIVRP